MFNSMGSALSLVNIRDLLSEAMDNANFGRWTIIDHLGKRENNPLALGLEERFRGSIPDNLRTTEDICFFDSFVEFNREKNNEVTDYPIEQGSFSSLNKIRKPDVFEAVLCKSGLNTNEAFLSFINSLEAYCDGYRLVDIVTPFKTYTGINLHGMSYSHRFDDGANMLFVHLTGKEIMQSGVFRQAVKKNPNSASTVSVGRTELEPLEGANVVTNAFGRG